MMTKLGWPQLPPGVTYLPGWNGSVDADEYTLAWRDFWAEIDNAKAVAARRTARQATAIMAEVRNLECEVMAGKRPKCLSLTPPVHERLPSPPIDAFELHLAWPEKQIK